LSKKLMSFLVFKHQSNENCLGRFHKTPFRGFIPAYICAIWH
jgi:hypothetical protein